jgi:FkbM family methyltransferase
MIRDSMQLDRYISKVTRKIGRLPGTRLAVEMLRRHFAARYALQPDRWALLSDFDGDLTLRVDRSTYMGSLIYWWGYHANDEFRVLRQFLKPDMVAVDVGANQGEFTVFLAKRLRAGRVFSFEPVLGLYAQLIENLRLNGFTNVEPHNVGLSNAEQIRPMFTTGEVERYHSYNEGLATIYADPIRSTEIGTARFDVFDERYAKVLPRLDFIKIDVEGAELPVLQGAKDTIAKHKPAILLEVNEDAFNAAGYEKTELLGFLQQFGYKHYIVEEGGRLREVRTGERTPRFCNVFSRVS